MQLTYRFNMKSDDQIEILCKVSNNLYNQANYIIKSTLNETHKWVRYNELEKIMKVTKNLEGTINYCLLKAQTSQQILRQLDKNWSSYFKALKEYKKYPDKFKAMPRAPGFKKKNAEFNLTYTNQNCTIKNGYVHLSKTLKVYIPQFDKYKDNLKNFQQVRIIPHGVIYNGKIPKSVNQYYNKETSKLKSIRDNEKEEGEFRSWNNIQIKDLTSYRNNFIEDYFHKVSRHIVNFLLENKIGNLVVGVNKDWKDSISLGNKTNQNFVCLPHTRLFSYLKYKCEKVGIKFQVHEESYTSKCDGLALEEICKHENYLGKRIHRGLFKSSVGKLINADVNGTLNILRKVIGDSPYVRAIIDSGFLFNPVKVSVV